MGTRKRLVEYADDPKIRSNLAVAIKAIFNRPDVWIGELRSLAIPQIRIDHLNEFTEAGKNGVNGSDSRESYT